MAAAARAMLTDTTGTGSSGLSLPPLRADLERAPGPLDAQGRPGLLLVDRLRNSYFRLVWPVSLVIEHWRPGEAETLADMLARRHDVHLTPRDFEDILTFLYSNELTETDRQHSWRALAETEARQRANPITQAFSSLMFLRLPLVEPGALLRALAPAVDRLLSPAFALAYATILCVAGYFVLRQWEAFTADISAMISLDALAWHAALLFGLKLVHELGHATIAHRYGCKVPTMGVALMLGIPVLYTDTTDSWRLTERSKRLAVVMAGVGAEMLVAGVALALWGFMAEGMARQLLASLAVMSVATSLLVNLNPCMRFDGYFALSDLLDIPNLQDRAFARTRDHLRKTLFGLTAPGADDLDPRTARLLVAYGYATWLYRLTLYAGIALMLYLMTFKALALGLMAYQLYTLILRPVGAEVAHWWQRRAEITAGPRSRWTLSLAALALLILVLPWSRVVEAPAVLTARLEAPLHAAHPARIAARRVSDGDAVSEGELLLRLESPALIAQHRRIVAEIAALELRLARAPALEVDREQALVLARELDAARQKLAALARSLADLDIRAPITGILVDLDAGLNIGTWVQSRQVLGRIVGTAGQRARAYVEAADAERLKAGASAVFIAESGLKAPIALRLVSIGDGTEPVLLDTVLAQAAGGPIPTRQDRTASVPLKPLVGVSLESDGSAPLMMERGIVRLTASGRSPLAVAFNRFVSVLTRESGF